MLYSTTDGFRMALNAKRPTDDALPTDNRATGPIPSDAMRFPPVEDVVLALDQIASRAFAS